MDEQQQEAGVSIVLGPVCVCQRPIHHFWESLDLTAQSSLSSKDAKNRASAYSLHCSSPSPFLSPASSFCAYDNRGHGLSTSSTLVMLRGLCCQLLMLALEDAF